MLTREQVKQKWIEIIESVHKEKVFSSVEGAWQLAQWVNEVTHNHLRKQLLDLVKLEIDVTETCRFCNEQHPDHDDGCPVITLRKIIEDL
jgi:hypothetical protein